MTKDLVDNEELFGHKDWNDVTHVYGLINQVLRKDLFDLTDGS